MRILLADDHKLFTESLSFLLGTYGIEVVGIAENGFEALQKAEEYKPDVVLLDIMMPGCNGIQALKRIKEKLPETKVVMLTTSEEDEYLFQAVKFGASGYLLKNLNGAELVDMLLNMSKGGAPLSPKLAARLMKELRVQEKPDTLSERRYDTPAAQQLSGRQIEVLKAVAAGMTYKEVGELLHITERTVKYHMATIMDVLEMENKSQVISYAAKMGWTEGKE